MSQKGPLTFLSLVLPDPRVLHPCGPSWVTGFDWWPVAPWAICLQSLWAAPRHRRTLSCITSQGSPFRVFLKQGVSCGSGWRPAGSYGVTGGVGAWGSGIRFPPKDGIEHRTSKGRSQVCLLPSEPHIFHRKVEGHWRGEEHERPAWGHSQ